MCLCTTTANKMSVRVASDFVGLHRHLNAAGPTRLFISFLILVKAFEPDQSVSFDLVVMIFVESYE